MSTSTRRRVHVLVLAHVFPRSLDDSMGAFLLHLADALVPCDVATTVVAPHAAGLDGEQAIGYAHIYRFRYAPARWERLAYTGTMHELVARGLLNKLLFVLFNLAFFVKTLSVIRATRPAVLHAHWWLPDGLVGALAALVTRVPLVITTHGTDVEMLRRKGWTKSLARFVFSRARVITCGSTYLRDQLLELGAADAARVSLIPMPVNPIFQISDFRHLHLSRQTERAVARYARRDPAGRAVQVLQVETPRPRQTGSFILTVARLTKQKSIETLIDALAILRARGRGTRLGVIGSGPERDALEEQVKRLKLEECVEFLGAQPQSELPLFYANCGVFVLPSLREGMGLVLAEALLCGAPVVAAQSGGVTDIVKDGETGLLVPEREPAALADAIDKLLDDRELAARLAANGRTWVAERYTPAGVAARFAGVYRTASGESRRMSKPAPSQPPEELNNQSPTLASHAPLGPGGRNELPLVQSGGTSAGLKAPFGGVSNLQSLISNPQLRRVVGYVLALAVLFFLGRLLLQTWDELAAAGFRFEFNWPRLVISLVLLVVARAFAVEAWRRILISLGESFGFGFGARVWFLSNLTRYIPGNIWQVATMMTMVEQRGVGKTNALLSQVVYTALALSIAGLLGAGFFLLHPEVLSGLLPLEIATYAPLILAAGFVALVVIFALPQVNHLLVQWTARLTRRSITVPPPTFARGLVPPFFSLAMWLTNGIAFYLFVSSMVDISPEQLPACIVMNAGAYLIGYASFVTPSGLGFREGALAWMLASLFPTPVAIALSLATRLWSTAGELLGVVLVWSVPERKPSPAGPEGSQAP